MHDLTNLTLYSNGRKKPVCIKWSLNQQVWLELVFLFCFGLFFFLFAVLETVKIILNGGFFWDLKPKDRKLWYDVNLCWFACHRNTGERKEIEIIDGEEINLS